MHRREIIHHLRRRWRAIAALAALAWAPALGAVFVVFTLGGGITALTDNVFLTVVVLHAAIAAGYALAVPALLDVLHTDAALGAAVRTSGARAPLNVGLALTVVPTTLLAASLWPEIWGTVAEVIAVQVIAAAPIVLFCQLLWMQQVADGGDAPTVLHDTTQLVRDCAPRLVAMLVPTYLVAFALVGANLVPTITAPLAMSLASVPFTVWTWFTWCSTTGARASWAEPIRAASTTEQTNAGSTVDQPRLAPILLGGGGPARLELATTPGIAAGAWLQLEPGDGFTISVRVSDRDSREWAAYLWRPGGQWRELEQLWNDGSVFVAHGFCWGERAYLAVARRDGRTGVPFTAWVSVATQAATQEHPVADEHERVA